MPTIFLGQREEAADFAQYFTLLRQLRTALPLTPVLVCDPVSGAASCAAAVQERVVREL